MVNDTTTNHANLLLDIKILDEELPKDMRLMYWIDRNTYGWHRDTFKVKRLRDIYEFFRISRAGLDKFLNKFKELGFINYNKKKRIISINVNWSLQNENEVNKIGLAYFPNQCKLEFTKIIDKDKNVNYSCNKCKLEFTNYVNWSLHQCKPEFTFDSSNPLPDNELNDPKERSLKKDKRNIIKRDSSSFNNFYNNNQGKDSLDDQSLLLESFLKNTIFSRLNTKILKALIDEWGNDKLIATMGIIQEWYKNKPPKEPLSMLESQLNKNIWQDTDYNSIVERTLRAYNGNEIEKPLPLKLDTANYKLKLHKFIARNKHDDKDLDLWNRTKEKLKDKVVSRTYDLLIKKLRLICVEKKRLVLLTPTRESASLLRYNHQDNFIIALGELGSEINRVLFIPESKEE